MAQSINNNIVLREDDVAVFTCQLKNELFGDNFAGRAQKVNFERNDAVQTALADFGDATLFQVLAQQHAKGRRHLGVLRQLRRDIQHAAAAAHVAQKRAGVLRTAHKQQQ